MVNLQMAERNRIFLIEMCSVPSDIQCHKICTFVEDS